MINKATLDRSKMPAAGEHIKLHLKEPIVHILDNGITLYLIEDETIEFNRMDFVFSAGTSFQNRNLIAESTLNLLSEGTQTRSSAEIAEKLDYYGCFIDSNLSKDKASISIYSLTKQLPEILPIISDIVQNPTFNETELSNYLVRKKHQFNNSYRKVKYRSMLEFNELIFGSDTSYGNTKKLDDFDKVTRQDVVQYHNSHFSLKNGYIVASGKIGRNTIDNINRYFGNIEFPSVTESELSFTNNHNTSSEGHFIKVENSLQSAIRIGLPVVSKTHKDYISLVVLNTVLGGYFGSRLMSNIRENKGYTYGINSFIINYLHGGYLCIATEVNAKNTNDTLSEIQTELNNVRDRLIPVEELDLVKNYIYGTYLRSFDGSISQTDRFRAAKDLNMDYLYYIESLQSMLNQSPEQLREIANKYLDYNSMIKLVVGSLKDGKF